MAYKKMTVDWKIVVAFTDRRVCDIFEPPLYIQRYLGLKGVQVSSATGQEYKKYKRTRKNRLTVQEQLKQIEMW